MKNIHSILKQYWGYDNFRPLQEEIIKSVLNGIDTLALLPTGGGKSICFQVPALALDGICIVISPLIALMKDQVEQLNQRGISAVAIYSGMHSKEIDIMLDNCIYGNIKFLYVSPERLESELFIERVKKMNVSLLAIDEAHCISQWGYDFRPSYLKIASFKKYISQAKIIALTASATAIVQKDIQEKLEFTNPKVFKKTFARDNLSYSCLYEEDKEKRILNIFTKVKGTAIIYVRNRKRTKQVAEYLVKNKISATYYHAGLSHAEREQKQNDWIQNRVRVMVATNAFGMGIDKPNVRTVIHIDLPDNLESYYQEAGRAGRDEKKAYAIILYILKDIDNLETKINQEYPSVEFLKKVYQCLANYFQLAVGSHTLQSYDFDLDEFRKNFNLPSIETFYALKKLEEEGFIQFNESFYKPSQLFIPISHQALYEYQVANSTHDLLIKTILRMYGGELLVNFLSISEKNIAKQMKVSEKEVVSQLVLLHKRTVFIYEKQKDTPQLVFLSTRYPADKLPIQSKKIEERKATSMKRVKAMTHYIQQNVQCRTLVILDYFDEKEGVACGICDICINKNKSSEITDQYKKYHDQIIELLKKESLDIKEIIKKINPGKEKEILECIRLMIGSEEIHYLKNGKMSLN